MNVSVLEFGNGNGLNELGVAQTECFLRRDGNCAGVSGFLSFKILVKALNGVPCPDNNNVSAVKTAGVKDFLLFCKLFVCCIENPAVLKPTCVV